MGLPRITYNPGTSRNVDFPEELSELEDPATPKREIVETDGGVVGVYFSSTRDDVTVIIPAMPRSAGFEKEMVALWSWMGKGGEFSFAEDSADVINTTVRTAAAAGALQVQVASSAGLSVGKNLILQGANDKWQREQVTVNGVDVTNAPSFDLAAGAGLVYAWAVSDLVRSVHFFPKCVALSPRFPLTRIKGNNLRFELRFRTFVDIQVA